MTKFLSAQEYAIMVCKNLSSYKKVRVSIRFVFQMFYPHYFIFCYFICKNPLEYRFSTKINDQVHVYIVKYCGHVIIAFGMTLMLSNSLLREDASPRFP